MTVSQPAPPLGLTRKPFYGLHPVSWAIYRATWWIWWMVDKVMFRTRCEGLETLEDGGPVLLLSNHVGLLDPFWVALHIWRPSRFMAASSVLKIPVIGPYLGVLGAFPKMKYVKDREAMKTLTDHYDNGHVVTVFPEGVRTWTGRPGLILPGIGRLIKRLDARVLYGRIRSGYYILPRWAKYPRYVPLEIDYFGPVTYDAALSEEAITEDVRMHLDVQPVRDTSRVAFGFRLAEGLTDLLWACPSCFSLESLRVQGWRRRDIGCVDCGATWRLDVDTVLNGLGDAPTLRVDAAYDQIRAHFGDPPVFDPERQERDGVVAHADLVRVRHMRHSGAPALVAEGALEVQADRLRVRGAGDAVWELDFDDLLSVSTEVGSQVFLRRASEHPRGDLYRLETPGHASLKWGTLLQAWHRSHRDRGDATG